MSRIDKNAKNNEKKQSNGMQACQTFFVAKFTCITFFNFISAHAYIKTTFSTMWVVCITLNSDYGKCSKNFDHFSLSVLN